MGLFNEHSSTTKTDSSISQIPGPQGIGYKLDANGNFDIENKKLTNVQNGDMDRDVMTKSQIEGYVSNKTQYIDNINPGEVKNNKAAIYSNTGSLHSNSLYLKDQYKQEVILHTENQDDNQIRLYIPNLKNYDSFGGRLKSSLVITSLDQIIEGRKVFHNIEVPNPAIDSQACNRAFVLNELSKISDNYVRKSGDSMIGSLIVPKDNYPIQGNLNKVLSYETQREIFLSKREGGKMLQPIDMNGFSIDNLPLPTAVDHASTKGYTDNKVDSKANKSDLNDYMKLDGSKVMTGTLNMNNNRITNLPSPHSSTEPATKDYVTTVMNHLPSLFLDRQGKSTMLGNLNMNNHLIQNVKDPDNTDDCANKKYVDSQISKANIKPSHTPKNAFKYLMDDVNEWSTEYNVEVKNFINLNEIPHSWNKRVLSISPIKDGKNYRFRLGLQMGSLIKNQAYSLVVEMFNRDFTTWERQETFIEGTGIWLKTYNTLKFQHHYGNNNTLYYSKTLIKFNKTSLSGSLTQIYFTIHFDDKGGDLNTYANKFENQIYILAYGALGDINNISPMIYDKHEAYVIEKTKIKMLVNLDMNGHRLLNVNNIVNNGIFSIYSQIDINDYFIYNNQMPIKFESIYITSILIKPLFTDRNKSKILNINSINRITKYPFQFDNTFNIKKLVINTYFSTIQNIQLSNAKYNPFILQYKLYN